MRSAAALAATFAAGAATGVSVAPPKTDPLGGWHYADRPVRVCLAQDGEGQARASVRPEIVTVSGVRVHVPDLNATRAEFYTCRASLPEQFPSRLTMSLCFDRDGNVELEGRNVGNMPIPSCVLDIFERLISENPIAPMVTQ